MKQYRITSENILQDSPDDCFLAPDDPIQELKIASYLGGLGAESRLHEYRANQIEQKAFSDERGKYQRENNIKPGTPAWFELWSKPL
jgi:hypothetical protein